MVPLKIQRFQLAASGRVFIDIETKAFCLSNGTERD
jgi:hypothetical protein